MVQGSADIPGWYHLPPHAVWNNILRLPAFAGDQNKVTISTKIDAVYNQK